MPFFSGQGLPGGRGSGIFLGPNDDYYAINPATGQAERLWLDMQNAPGATYSAESGLETPFGRSSPYDSTLYFESDPNRQGGRYTNRGGDRYDFMDFAAPAAITGIASFANPVLGGAVGGAIYGQDEEGGLNFGKIAKGAALGYVGGQVGSGVSNAVGGGTTGAVAGGAASGAVTSGLSGGGTKGVLQGAVKGGLAGTLSSANTGQPNLVADSGQTMNDAGQGDGGMAYDDYGSYDPNDPYGGSTAYPDDSVYYPQPTSNEGTSGVGGLLSDFEKFYKEHPGLMKLLGTGLSTGLGVAGAKNRTNQYDSLAAGYRAMGAPYRERLAASYADPNAYLNSPEVQIPVQQGTNALARALSVQGGNPYGNPHAQSEIENYASGQLFGRLGQERDRLAGFGGLTYYNQAAPGAAGARVDASGGVYGALGTGAANVFNPTPTLAEQLGQILMGRQGRNQQGPS